MVGRHELTDQEWQHIEGILPCNKGAGRPWHDHRTMLNGMLWTLCTGAPWRDLPKRYGKWKSVHARLTRWRADGTWDRIVQHLQCEMDEQGLLDWGLWCIDGSNVRATRAAAGARTRGGLRMSRLTTLLGAHEAGSGRSFTL